MNSMPDALRDALAHPIHEAPRPTARRAHINEPHLPPNTFLWAALAIIGALSVGIAYIKLQKSRASDDA